MNIHHYHYPKDRRPLAHMWAGTRFELSPSAISDATTRFWSEGRCQRTAAVNFCREDCRREKTQCFRVDAASGSFVQARWGIQSPSQP